MGGTAKANAMRSAVVVLGALSFGYLTLRLGFKPYLEKAELEQQRREAQYAAAAAAAAASHSRDSFDDGFPTDGDNLSSGLLESDHKKFAISVVRYSGDEFILHSGDVRGYKLTRVASTDLIMRLQRSLVKSPSKHESVQLLPGRRVRLKIGGVRQPYESLKF